MINQLEIPMYLEESLPEIKKEFPVAADKNAFKSMNALVHFTCDNIETHNYSRVKKCFKIAEKLYAKGNDCVRNAVQNIFVFSFTRMFQTYPEEKQRLLLIIPITLYTLYIAQVCHKGS